MSSPRSGDVTSGRWSSRDLASPIKLALESRVLTVRTTLSTDGHSCILGAIWPRFANVSVWCFPLSLVVPIGMQGVAHRWVDAMRQWVIDSMTHHRSTKSCPRFTCCKLLVRCTITSPLDLSIGCINSAKIGLPFKSSHRFWLQPNVAARVTPLACISLTTTSGCTCTRYSLSSSGPCRKIDP